jgi:hypothetical protein
VTKSVAVRAERKVAIPERKRDVSVRVGAAYSAETGGGRQGLLKLANAGISCIMIHLKLEAVHGNSTGTSGVRLTKATRSAGSRSRVPQDRRRDIKGNR